MHKSTDGQIDINNAATLKMKPRDTKAVNACFLVIKELNF